MNNFSLAETLKQKRLTSEENDKCFYSGEFLKDPVEIFHPLIGFVTISKKYKYKAEKEIKNYENKHKDKTI